MNQAVLLLGGNIGDRLALIIKATDIIINSCGTLKNKSRLYESEAWGFETNNNFLNQAISIETKYSAPDLLKITQSIELKLGRKQKTSAKYESRPIDIDILFYNSDIIDSEKLTIPHPRLHMRMFTLFCLMDIIPNFIHPILEKNISQLQQQCSDTVKAWPYE